MGRLGCGDARGDLLIRACMWTTLWAQDGERLEGESSGDHHFRRADEKEKEDKSMKARGFEHAPTDLQFQQVYMDNMHPVPLSSADQSGHVWGPFLNEPHMQPHGPDGGALDPRRFELGYQPEKAKSAWVGTPVHSEKDLVAAGSWFFQEFGISSMQLRGLAVPEPKLPDPVTGELNQKFEVPSGRGALVMSELMTFSETNKFLGQADFGLTPRAVGSLADNFARKLFHLEAHNRMFVNELDERVDQLIDMAECTVEEFKAEADKIREQIKIMSQGQVHYVDNFKLIFQNDVRVAGGKARQPAAGSVLKTTPSVPLQPAFQQQVPDKRKQIRDLVSTGGVHSPADGADEGKAKARAEKQKNKRDRRKRRELEERKKAEGAGSPAKEASSPGAAQDVSDAQAAAKEQRKLNFEKVRAEQKKKAGGGGGGGGGQGKGQGQKRV